MTSTPKPNTFIIGAPKCGTSALAKYLSEHPNVLFSTPKEPFFWCDDFPRLKHEMSLETMADYLSVFQGYDPQLHTVIAEGSTRYLRSSVAIERILSYNPDARFIAMVRNPIELVQAYHMEQRYSLHEDIASFEEAGRAQDERAIGRRIPRGCREPAFLQYGKVGLLGEQIQYATELIPKDRLRIITLDDFKADTPKVYKETLRFLGLVDDRRQDFPVVNSAHAHRHEWLAKLILTPPKIIERPLRSVRRHLWEKRYGPVEWIKGSLNTRKPRQEISPALRDELKQHFRQDVDKLSNLIGKDLGHWTA